MVVNSKLRAQKISQTFKNKKIDNFKEWRHKMRQLGRIPVYKSFPKSEDLAEFIGVILGDGNISSFLRTERLIIVGNTNNMGFIKHYNNLTFKIFNKKPTISKIKDTNAIRISLYQKFIAKRLGIPTGNRYKYQFILPKWISKKRVYMIKLLKGLFEAEGSLSIHKKTYTYNFQFKNINQSLLRTVTNGLIYLGYNPEVRIDSIRLRKRKEVDSFKNLIRFRQYRAE